MNKHIDWIKNTRLSLLQLVAPLTMQQLNEVPAGFNNNIIWNLAHLVAVQQALCYLRSSVSPVVDEQYIRLYMKGTKPQDVVEAAEIVAIKETLVSSLDRFALDYQKSLFNNYQSWTTPFDTELGTIDDAIIFLQFHEGLHYGYVMALKRLVSK
ncbi:MAG TPA: DinB family protein [Segetibacter sp.]|jgi:hypothetical protein